jgi:hypothetical protein
MDYEFTLVLDLDIKHQATSSKDRTGLFTNPLPFLVSESTGNKIKIWCLGEDLLRNIEQQVANAKTVQELRNILLKYPTLKDRIEPLCLNRKKELESIVPESVVEPPKTS